jgi:two-component system, LytTR family, sensor kinase
VVIGLLEMVRTYAGFHVGGYPLSWWEAFWRTTPYWVTLGVLLAPLASAIRRLPLEQGRWRRSLPVHLAIAVLFAIIHNVLGGLVADAVLQDRLTTPEDLIRRLFSPTPLVDFFSYAVLVAASFAFTYHVRASELEASLAQARLEALRMQLNPHFLFNTLNATSVLALKGEREKVAGMLTRLSDLLRTVLEGSAQVVPLAEEIDLLARYLEIERVRFEDRLTVRVEIDPDVLDAEVPVLVLQPLAENAIRHGVSRRPGPGRVEVRGRAEGGRLVIEVRDSGPGFVGPPDLEAQAGGVGLANTRARLAQLYGDAATLELSEAAEGGGLVRLVLPLRGEEPRR